LPHLKLIIIIMTNKQALIFQAAVLFCKDFVKNSEPVVPPPVGVKSA